MKYIDSEKLIAEIERLIKVNKELTPRTFTQGVAAGYADVLSAVTSLQQEQPMPDSTELIAKWEEEKDVLKQMDFRGDEWRLAQNAFMDGFGIGLSVKQEQPEVELEEEYKTWWDSIKYKINIEHVMEWYMHETARRFYELGLNARKEE